MVHAVRQMAYEAKTFLENIVHLTMQIIIFYKLDLA